MPEPELPCGRALLELDRVDRPQTYRVLILPGDGIGPEVVAVGEKVLLAVAGRFGLNLRLAHGEIGQGCVLRHGVPLTEETLQRARESDGVLLGAVGGTDPGKESYSVRPEAGLLALRKGMELFANLRPVRLMGALVDASPLKASVVEGVDLLVVRELLGDVYFGEPRGRGNDREQEAYAYNTMRYSRSEIERVARVAFQMARQRRRRVVSVDKANVLETGLFWREVVTRVQGEEFPDVALSHQYVDNCAMQLIRNPRQFDVILTSNLFGDILSDEASVLAGSIGMLPSASLGLRGALFEPIHGSAPDIAGRDVANPLATVLSVALMYRHAFGRPDAGSLIEKAVEQVLQEGYRTADIFAQGTRRVGTREMGERVLEKLEELCRCYAS